MRASAQASRDQVDIPALFRNVGRSLPRLILFALVAGGFTWLGLTLVAPRFASEARMAVAAKGADGQPQAVGSHISALRSRELAQKVITDLKLGKKVEFNSALGSPDFVSAALHMAGIVTGNTGEKEQDRVLSAYFQRLEVYPAGEDAAIGVRMSATDPQLAAAIANGLVDAYQASLATRAASALSEVEKTYDPKLQQARGTAADAETALKAFQQSEAAKNKEAQPAAAYTEQQLSELASELGKAKAARGAADARLQAARDALKSGNTDALGAAQKSARLQDLERQRVRLERQIAEQAPTLPTGHPRMQQMLADLSGVKKQFAAEMAKTIDGLESEAKLAGLRADSIAKNLEDIKSRMMAARADEGTLRKLEVDVKSKQNELAKLTAEYEAARAAAEARAKPGAMQVIARAEASSVPVFPKKTSMSALIMVATFLLGLAIMVTRDLVLGIREPKPKAKPASRIAPELLDPAIAPAPAIVARNPEPTALTEPPRNIGPDIPAATMLLPEPKNPIKIDEPLKGIVMFRKSAPAAAPAVKPGSMAELATRIVGKATGPRGFRSLVVGERQTLGAGTEALEYAETLAAAGRSVVVIDWSAQGEGLGAEFGIPTTPGLADLIAGQATFEDIVKALPGGAVHGIGPGAAPEGGIAALEAERINLVLDALDEAYDHIVVMARYEEACELFEVIEGRFDAGVLVCEGKRRVPVIDQAEQTFLGFEVTDIELMRYERPPGMGVPSDRLQKFTQPTKVRAGAA